MSVEIVVRFLEENLYAEHFINYYLQLGFDHIHILYEKNQKPFPIKNEKVSVIVHDYVGNHVFHHLKELMTTDAEWILFCDADEYLYLKEFPTIQAFLKTIPTNVDQLFFQWAMIENVSYMTGTHDLFELLQTNNMYINSHIKSMVRYKNMNEKIMNPHNWKGVEKNYLWDHYVSPVPCHDTNVDNYIFTSYPFLIHFHTRSLQNIFIKGLKTNLTDSGKGINSTLLTQYLNEHNIEEIKQFRKVQLPFEHCQYPSLSLTVSLKGSSINFDLENDQLKEICAIKNIDFDKLLAVIKELDTLDSHTFKKAV